MTIIPTYEEIRLKALELGWDDIGVTSPEIPEADITSYRDWISQGYHGNLAYMENELRTAPEQLFPGARSALLFISNYKQPRLPFRTPEEGLIASYARHRDYHNVHRRRLKRFIRWLEERSNTSEIALGFSDSKPILEKALFVKAGLGWFGKNSLLIHRRFGTFMLLSGVLTKLDLHPSPVISTRELRCGVCNRCAQACPTGAIIRPYVVDAKQCLSYHLIEGKGPIPEHIAKANPGYAFGCDICQDVCPHNVRSPLSTSPDFQPPNEEAAYLSFQKLSERNDFDGTPLKRRGKRGLIWNLESLQHRNCKS